MEFGYSAVFLNGVFHYVFHKGNRMRISHGNAGKIKFPIQNFHCFTDNGMLVTQNGNFCRLQHRLTHIHSYAFHNAILYMQLQNLDAAQCFQCHRCFLRQSSFVNIFADTTRSVAAHFPLRAIQIKHSHAKIRSLGRHNQNQSVRANPKMALTHGNCQLFGILHLFCKTVYVNIVIPAALHFCKTHIPSLLFFFPFCM